MLPLATGGSTAHVLSTDYALRPVLTSLGADRVLPAAYGELVVTFRAAEELAVRAVAELTAGLARGPSPTDEERGEIAVRAATARAAATTAVLRITSGALEATGVHSTASHLGLDRFWRNARARTLYEPADRALHEVGEHFLPGTHPPSAPHPG